MCGPLVETVQRLKLRQGKTPNKAVPTPRCNPQRPPLTRALQNEDCKREHDNARPKSTCAAKNQEPRPQDRQQYSRPLAARRQDHKTRPDHRPTSTTQTTTLLHPNKSPRLGNITRPTQEPPTPNELTTSTEYRQAKTAGSQTHHSGASATARNWGPQSPAGDVPGYAGKARAAVSSS